VPLLIVVGERNVVLETSFLDRASNFLIEDVSSDHGSSLERGNIRN